VVATMWRIDDVAAADMATAFYRAQSAAGSDVALANAQRAMLRTPATSSPYFWASHQLIGDSRTWVDVPRANVQ
jgi:CHAT domain-containing protein